MDCFRDSLAPIITPHEAFLAFTGRPFDAATYRLDFGDLLQPKQQQQHSSMTCDGIGLTALEHFTGNISQAEDQAGT